MRMFIAAEFENIVKDKIGYISSYLKEVGVKGNFVSTGNLHLTFKFLGEVDSKKLAEIQSMLTEAVKNHARFVMTTGKCGTFSSGRGEILWLGLEKSDAVLSLAKDINQVFSGPQFKESKAFNPHITLVRDAVYDHDTFQKSPEFEKFNIPVSFVTLYESRRINGVLNYIPVFRVPLL